MTTESETNPASMIALVPRQVAAAAEHRARRLRMSLPRPTPPRVELPAPAAPDLVRND